MATNQLFQEPPQGASHLFSRAPASKSCLATVDESAALSWSSSKNLQKLVFVLKLDFPRRLGRWNTKQKVALWNVANDGSLSFKGMGPGFSLLRGQESRIESG